MNISEALGVLKNDADLIAKKTFCETKKTEKEESDKKAKLEELKNNQKVTVQSALAYDDGYSFVFRKATVVVRNNTNQVLKDYTVGILMFDNNGYPIEVRYSFQGDENLFRGRGQSANVQPGGTYGSNQYWDIEDNATKIKACVIRAEFYDGSTWENEYFNYWLEDNKGRY